MLNRFRASWTKLLTPIAKFLIRMGVSPDAVTLAGTAGVVGGALVFFPRGELLVGVLVITAFVFSDMLDGTMARMSGTSSKWGAFLDSTLDRLGDAAIFGGLVLYFAGHEDNDPLAALALYCLVMGSVTSYARARAESLGLVAWGGLA
jgi:CDP-diacylglycerol---glycerol-3-phosphate 3-phosphatidyltransferase